GIAGEILAGILIGPSVLHWVAPNDTMKALSDLGVLFLLFSIGLDVRLADLLRVGLLSTLVATLGEIVPFVAGWGILLAWGGTARTTRNSRPRWCFFSVSRCWPSVPAWRRLWGRFWRDCRWRLARIRGCASQRAS